MDNKEEEIELLLFCPSPREIPEFYQGFNKIRGYDKFFVRYLSPGVKAYRIGREAFLSSEYTQGKKYTHLVLIPDDLLVEQHHVDRLYQDIHFFYDTLGKEVTDSKHCIGGYCNVDTTLHKHLSNIVWNERVRTSRIGRVYNFASLEDIRNTAQIQRRYGYGVHTFREAKFMGFPMLAIPRPIVEQIEFRNDSDSGVDRMGCCMDVMFCNDALEKGAHLWVDLDLEMMHIKHSDSQKLYWMVGMKPPCNYWEYELTAVSSNTNSPLPQ